MEFPTWQDALEHIKTLDPKKYHLNILVQYKRASETYEVWSCPK